MAAKRDTPFHHFVWTPLNNSQVQTTKSRCDQCGSRASHPVHRMPGLQWCKNCHEVVSDSTGSLRHVLYEAQKNCSHPELRVGLAGKPVAQ